MSVSDRHCSDSPIASEQQAGTPRFIVIGGGKMGGAIVAGLVDSQEPFARDLTAQDFLIVNPGEDRRRFLSDTYGVRCVASVSEIGQSGFVEEYPSVVDPARDQAVALCDRPLIVILAVKPQVMFNVIREIAELPFFQGGEEGPLFVSIAAGITLRSLAEALPKGSRIIRTMPNMPLLVGAGATGICVDPTTTAVEDLPCVQDLFACLGQAFVVEEEQLDVVCALSGSGPAYVAHMIEVLVEASIAQGLSRELAEPLALQTVLGTALVLDQGDQSPTELREAVSSPGGTTLAALDAMAEAGFDEALSVGIEAAVHRSKELAAG